LKQFRSILHYFAEFGSAIFYNRSFRFQTLYVFSNIFVRFYIMLLILARKILEWASDFIYFFLQHFFNILQNLEALYFRIRAQEFPFFVETFPRKFALFCKLLKRYILESELQIFVCFAQFRAQDFRIGASDFIILLFCNSFTLFCRIWSTRF